LIEGDVQAATKASYVAEVVVIVLTVAPPVVQSSRHETVMFCVALVLQVVVLPLVVLPFTWHLTSFASVLSTEEFSVVLAIFSTAR
jgi:hypothetical protein